MNKVGVIYKSPLEVVYIQRGILKCRLRPFQKGEYAPVCIPPFCDIISIVTEMMF